MTFLSCKAYKFHIKGNEAKEFRILIFCGFLGEVYVYSGTKVTLCWLNTG